VDEADDFVLRALDFCKAHGIAQTEVGALVGALERKSDDMLRRLPLTTVNFEVGERKVSKEVFATQDPVMLAESVAIEHGLVGRKSYASDMATLTRMFREALNTPRPHGGVELLVDVMVGDQQLPVGVYQGEPAVQAATRFAKAHGVATPDAIQALTGMIERERASKAEAARRARVFEIPLLVGDTRRTLRYSTDMEPFQVAREFVVSEGLGAEPGFADLVRDVQSLIVSEVANVRAEEEAAAQQQQAQLQQAQQQAQQQQAQQQQAQQQAQAPSSDVEIAIKIGEEEWIVSFPPTMSAQAAATAFCTQKDAEVRAAFEAVTGDISGYAPAMCVSEITAYLRSASVL
jgi:hypothetical protein